MKILVNADLIDVDGALLDKVRAAAGDFEVIVTTDADRIEQVIPDVEVVLGGIGPGLLPKPRICAGFRARPPASTPLSIPSSQTARCC